jgi:disulfide bond formation protein DsbB
MNTLLNPRIWYLLVALACAAMLGYGYYLQHVMFLDPCPLCIFQRLVFLWIGAIALVAAIHGPGPVGNRIYGGLLCIGGLVGIGIAWRHVWLQGLPPDEVPECGMGLNYMLDTMPFLQVLEQVLRGSGECAEVSWRFLGLSMPGWTLFWYAVFTVGTIAILLRASHKGLKNQ